MSTEHFKNAKVTFSFITKYKTEIIDNTKNYNKPMELIIGKEFILPVWEKSLTYMLTNKLVEYTFTEGNIQLSDYIKISKTVRNREKDNTCTQVNTHTCANHANFNNLTGYHDLNKLQDLFYKNNQSAGEFTFTFNILKTELSKNYEPELWQISALENNDEIEKYINNFKNKGNDFYKMQLYEDAKEEYRKGISVFKDLKTKENNSYQPDFNKNKQIDSKTIPLILNYCQCNLSLYVDNNKTELLNEVIKHTTEIIEKYEILDNPKVYFKRAKAHVLLINEDEAKTDINQMIVLDSKLGNVGKKLQAELNKNCKIRDQRLGQVLKF